MSTVGRIFIVLNLVLTFVLVGYAGAILYSSTSWRGWYEGLKKNGSTRVSQAEQERDATMADRNALREENQMLRQQLADTSARHNAVWRAYVAERASMKSLESKFGDLSVKLDGWDTIYSNMSSKVDDYNNKLNELQEAQARAAEDQRLARNREVAAAAFQVRAEQEKMALREQISRLQSDLEDREATLAVFIRTNPELASGGLAGLDPNLQGSVTNVAEGGDLMTVELSGGGGAGSVPVGASLALYSAREFKGFVVVREVSGIGSVVCKLVWSAEGASRPAVGDRVRPATL